MYGSRARPTLCACSCVSFSLAGPPARAVVVCLVSVTPYRVWTAGVVVRAAASSSSSSRQYELTLHSCKRIVWLASRNPIVVPPLEPGLVLPPGLGGDGGGAGGGDDPFQGSDVDVLAPW